MEEQLAEKLAKLSTYNSTRKEKKTNNDSNLQDKMETDYESDHDSDMDFKYKNKRLSSFWIRPGDKTTIVPRHNCSFHPDCAKKKEGLYYNSDSTFGELNYFPIKPLNTTSIVKEYNMDHRLRSTKKSRTLPMGLNNSAATYQTTIKKSFNPVRKIPLSGV